METPDLDTPAAALEAQGAGPLASTTGWLGAPLPAEFYRRAADEVAPELLGAYLAVQSPGAAPRVGRIVEVEAYIGEEDAACHAFKGLTPRTRTLYGPPGTAYVYLVYGMHELFNVVCQPAGVPHAVLVRAVEPARLPVVDGAALGPADTEGAPGGLGRAVAAGPARPGDDRRAANGPGKLTRFLGIGRRHDGSSLTAPPITVHAGAAPSRIVVTPRVGVAYAGRWAEAPLRYYDADSPAVSRPPKGRIGAG